MRLFPKPDLVQIATGAFVSCRIREDLSTVTGRFRQSMPLAMRYLFLVLTWSVALILLGTVGVRAAEKTGLEPEFRFRLSFEAATLDWNLGDVPIHVINNVAEGLYAIDLAGKLVPREATSLPKRLAHSRYRISLKPGLRWSDGAPVRAADYVFSWKRLRDPQTGSAYSYLLKELVDFKAVSENEIELTTTENWDTAILTHWATFPVREDLVRTFSERWARPPNLVYNGPYKITGYMPGEKFELAPNLMHSRPGKLPKAVALIIPDDTTALRLFEQGTLHFVPDLSSIDRKELERHKTELHRQPSPVLVYLGFDLKNELFKTAANRQALASRIDRKALAKVLGEQHSVTTRLLPVVLLKEMKAISENRSEPSKTGALASQTAALGYFEKGLNRTLCEFLQAQWKQKLGFQAQLTPSEVKTYWVRLEQNPYPVFLNTYGPPVWNSKYYFELLGSKHPMNRGHWKNADYDLALERNNTNQMLAIFDLEKPIAPLYFRGYEFLLSKKARGVKVNPMTSLDLSQTEF